MQKDDGGQAFPVPATESNFFYEGMTMRDYFAAKAMQGMISNPSMWDLINVNHAKLIADDAYLLADAMLKARSE